VEVSVVLRPRQPLGDLEARLAQPDFAPLSREAFAASYGADPAAIDRVHAFAAQHGLHVEEASAARRTVRLSGAAADVGAAFGVTLNDVIEADGRHYHVPDREPTLPSDLQAEVEAVLGLDSRPVARRR
jgi:kumamolisin